MARIRNTKQLGQRVDRTYLKRLYPIPEWRRILTLICVAAGLGWLGMYAIARNQTPYTAGSLTSSHAFLGKNCAVCHGASAGIGKKVADQQCGACHDGPIHQASQTFTPPCISCHVEHREIVGLSGANNAGCTQCHGSLRTRSGRLSVAANIQNMMTHPQFAQVAAAKDPGGLRFNHQKHVGELNQVCGDCHSPADVAQGMAKPDPHSHVSSRALMSIPTYAGTCMPCHALTVDDQISDPVPHDKPEVVHQFLEKNLTAYIASHPGDLGKDGAPRNAAAWVQSRIAADEKTLMGETCRRCHAFQPAEAFAVSAIVPTKVPARWFTKASFDHGAHKGLTCASCHAKALTSTVASDVLLPGIGVCRNCHAPGSASAGSNCSNCHMYHDWSKEKPVNGKYMIEQMTRLLPAGHGGINWRAPLTR
jgi:hypothetical protein